MTNGDEIRSMNDKELADFIEEINGYRCDVCLCETYCDEQEDCITNIRKWLEIEVK